MGETARYRNTWRVLRVLAGGILKQIFGFHCQIVQPEETPYLVVANHNTDLDPALVGLSFPRQMFFVASEHTLRKGLPSKILQYFFAPISRMKGATDAAAALEIIRTLRRGHNVCLFAEGNRSFSGVTGPIVPATGKLCKASGAALVTYRLEGGYLTTPRWSHTRRKGRMRGYPVHVYTPEQLKTMTPQQVNEAIQADIREDAFARQLEAPVSYRGKGLAEGLENALYLCPKCGKIGAMRGEGDRFFCACGMEATYTVKGFFAGEDAPFANVRDWDNWQQERMKDLCARLNPEEPAFFDEDMRLMRIGEKHTVLLEETGRLSMTGERLILGTRAFPIQEISNMALVGASTIVFTAKGEHYEIKASTPYYCGRKYLTLYELLKS